MTQVIEITRSIDTILKWFKETVEAKQPIPPTKWIEAGEFLNILIGEENDKLCELEQKVAEEKLGLMLNSGSVAEAKMKVEATNIYKEAKRQKNKIAQIIEFIRLAKLHARIYSDELRG
jgi:hypothetical protein